MTLKCHGRLRKYNATPTEYLCVCWANCPWRRLTDAEKAMNERFIQQLHRDARIRSIILGIAYCAVFILGVTGRYN